jgi:F-type H+-transporting ATPase subunit delta
VAARGIHSSALAARYAAALLELADERNELDRAAADLSALRAMLAESEDLRRLVESPLLSRADQGRAMAAVLEQAGLCDLVRRFVGLVARNRRLSDLDAMIVAFLAELASRRGEVTAEVTSAQPLDAEQQAALVEGLRRSVGGTVRMNLTVDRGLIGGLVVKIGSRLFDGSLKSKLQRLQLAMKGLG